MSARCRWFTPLLLSLVCTSAGAWISLLGSPLFAQVTALADVNPDSSDLDPSDPDGATGGRVNGTAVDPSNASVLYAASEWGGIYKSTDAGVTWARLDGHRPTVTWDVEVDPSNSNRVYATSFYDGKATALSGINVSTDGGATWTRPATAVPPNDFCFFSADETELTAFGIAIDPSDNSKVYIGTACGLAISDDSGATWSYSTPIAGGLKMWDVVVSSDGAEVETCGDDAHYTYNTVGDSWSAGSGLPSGQCSLAKSPYSDANLFGVVGITLYESLNGTNWTQTRTNPSPQGRIPFVETNLRSGTISQPFDLWFGDVSLYSVSCDADAPVNGFTCGTGTTPAWSSAYTRDVGGHDDMGSILFNPAAASDACPILMSSDGGVYRNTETTSPDCHSPSWEQPSVTPHGLWPFAMAGADRAGDADEDLYFGNQDNGVFGTTDAAASAPDWTNQECCDGFDTAADDFDGGSVIYSVCCFGGGRSTRFFRGGAGFSGAAEIDYPASGLPPGFKTPDAIVNWADNKYAMATTDCTVGSGGCPGADGGVFITEEGDASPIVWTELGNATEPPSSSLCGVRAGTSGDNPVFYAQTGSCNADSTFDRLFRFTGTDPTGAWTEITLPQGGIGIFTVSESDPLLLLAAGFTSDDAFLYKSTDGGDSWSSLATLDALMDGGGDFPITNDRGPTNFTGTSGYHQPSLVAIDPTDSSIMVAGGRDSGIFVSTDGGDTWSLVTDPRNSHSSGTPHIPRPWYAYFDEEDGAKSVFIGSQGRGIWRLDLDTGTCDDDLMLTAQVISGTDDFGALDTITTGPSFEVTQTGVVSLAAGQSVALVDGTSIAGEVSVKIDRTPCPLSPGGGSESVLDKGVSR